MNKVFIILGIVFLVVGALLFVGALAVNGFDFAKFKSGKTEKNTYTVNEPFQRLEIQAGDADVAFKQASDGVFRVECVEREKEKHSVRVEDGTLKITVQDERTWSDHIRLFSDSQSITVFLPAEEYESLHVDCSTGDMKIPAVFSFGSVDLTASTGDVSFEASVSGPARIRTSTGDILVKSKRVGELTLSVSTGAVELSGVTCDGSVSVSVTTGKMILQQLTCKDLKSDGSTGRVQMNQVSASESLFVERSTGDITFENIDAGEITVRTTTGDVTGSVSTEKVFVAKTSTGSVNVPDTTSGGKCQATTTTGDIRITLSKG